MPGRLLLKKYSAMNESLYDIVLRMPLAPSPVGNTQALLVTLAALLVMTGLYQLVWRGRAWYGHWQLHRLHLRLKRGGIDARTAAHGLAAVLRASQKQVWLNRLQPPRSCNAEQASVWADLVSLLNQARFQARSVESSEIDRLLMTAAWWLYRD